MVALQVVLVLCNSLLLIAITHRCSTEGVSPSASAQDTHSWWCHIQLNSPYQIIVNKNTHALKKYEVCVLYCVFIYGTKRLYDLHDFGLEWHCSYNHIFGFASMSAVVLCSGRSAEAACPLQVLPSAVAGICVQLCMYTFFTYWWSFPT